MRSQLPNRRRAAAALALAFSAAALAGVSEAAARDPLAGLGAVAAVAAAIWLAWQGLLHQRTPRVLLTTAAGLLLATALVLLAARALLLEVLVVGFGTAIAVAAMRVAFTPSGPAGAGWRPALAPTRPC